jgi:hypothetical protein
VEHPELSRGVGGDRDGPRRERRPEPTSGRGTSTDAAAQAASSNAPADRYRQAETGTAGLGGESLPSPRARSRFARGAFIFEANYFYDAPSLAPKAEHASARPSETIHNARFKWDCQHSIVP